MPNNNAWQGSTARTTGEIISQLSVDIENANVEIAEQTSQKKEAALLVAYGDSDAPNRVRAICKQLSELREHRDTLRAAREAAYAKQAREAQSAELERIAGLRRSVSDLTTARQRVAEDFERTLETLTALGIEYTSLSAELGELAEIHHLRPQQILAPWAFQAAMVNKSLFWKDQLELRPSAIASLADQGGILSPYVQQSPNTRSKK